MVLYIRSFQILLFVDTFLIFLWLEVSFIASFHTCLTTVCCNCHILHSTVSVHRQIAIFDSSRTMATVRKKIDNRIRVQIENGVALQHRTLFVVVGDRGRDQVIILWTRFTLPSWLRACRINMFSCLIYNLTIISLLIKISKFIPHTGGHSTSHAVKSHSQSKTFGTLVLQKRPRI